MIASAIALSMLSTSALANNTELKNPFKSEKNKVQDISFTYIHADYMDSDIGKHYTISASKSLNRFMFVDGELAYNTGSGVDGKDFGLGAGFNYPLPLPLDIAIADLYVKGGFKKRSYDEYLSIPSISSLTDAKIAYIDDAFSHALSSGSSLYGVAGVKSNFGSDDLIINMYGGVEKSKPDNKTLQHLIDEDLIEDTFLVAGLDFGYMLTKTTSIEVKTKYQYEEASFGLGITMYIF